MSGRAVRAAVWLPGLAVALGAAVATAHGLYEVAAASRVPAAIAWLYPLITDGLALVAYTATARLHGPAARYAWLVVVTAAGLSGLAQAAYLAGGPAVEVAPALRFGVGAWPAIAAAVVAHLLYLLATDAAPAPASVQSGTLDQPPDVQPAGVQPAPYTGADAGPERATGSGLPAAPADDDAAATPGRTAPSPARDRADAAAHRHAQRHGAWPTVTELEVAAEVSRGTAAAALKALRERPLPLHLITDGARRSDTKAEEPTHQHDHEANP